MNFELNYTIYSKKAFKNFFKFATQDNFDNSKKPNECSEIPDEASIPVNSSVNPLNSLEDLRKKELF